MDTLIPLILCVGFYLAAAPCGILISAALHFFPLRWTTLDLNHGNVVSMVRRVANDNRLEDRNRDRDNQSRKAA